MKKFLCLLVALLLIGSIALAESIDLSAMTDDDLLALKDQVNQTLSDRGITREFVVTSGIYVGGSDIRPGRYTLTATSENGMVQVAIGKDSESLNSNDGILYMDSDYINEGDDPKTFSLSIADGNVLVIKGDGEMKLEKADIIG